MTTIMPPVGYGTSDTKTMPSEFIHISSSDPKLAGMHFPGDPIYDTFARTTVANQSDVKKSETDTKTTEEKQAVLKKARATSAGWSVLFGPFATLYYGLRSDDKVAKKYNLDKEVDKDLIKEIKRQQTIQTIPGALSGGTLGIFAWLYNKVKNPDSIKV